MNTTWLLILLLGAVVDSSAQPGVGFEVLRRDPEQDLLARVGRITGAAPQDCGRLMQPGTWGKSAYVLGDLAGPISCAIASAGERRPFVVVLKTMGFDCWIASGLLGDSSGQLKFFTYDNLYGQGTLRTRPCGAPTAKVNADGFPHIECTR